MHFGTEWLVDAHGCDPEALRSVDTLQGFLARVVRELGLKTAGDPLWHAFPGPGGVSGLILLTESHLACHTFPEASYAAFSLYSCRPLDPWPWSDRLAEALGADEVRVRCHARGER